MLRSCQTRLANLLSRPGAFNSMLPSMARSSSSSGNPGSCCSGTHLSQDTPLVHSHKTVAPTSPHTEAGVQQTHAFGVSIKDFASLLPRHSSARITNGSSPISNASPQQFTSSGFSSGQRSLHSSTQMHATKSSDDKGFLWKMSQSQGHQINPCNSNLHPAVKEAGLKVAPDATEICVQEAYTPESKCWGCGPLNLTGLHLKSYRSGEGLTSRISLPAGMCAFPGIINGGILSTLVDCHGNWTAAICLMDQGCLPMPPLTLTSSILVNFKDTTPPETELVIRSRVVEIKQSSSPTGRTSVEVDVHIYQAALEVGGPEKLLVHASGLFKRLGAARAL